MDEITTTTRILVAADYQLVNKVFYRRRVWGPAVLENSNVRSRSGWLDALTMIYVYDGSLYFPDGRPYSPQDVDSVFADPQNRWMSNFLQADETGQFPQSYSHLLERLRMIELYCRLVKTEDWA